MGGPAKKGRRGPVAVDGRRPAPAVLGNLVVAGVGGRDLVRVALARGLGRVARRELPRREVGARRSDALFELGDVEAGLLRGLVLLVLHENLLVSVFAAAGAARPVTGMLPAAGTRCAGALVLAGGREAGGVHRD